VESEGAPRRGGGAPLRAASGIRWGGDAPLRGQGSYSLLPFAVGGRVAARWRAAASFGGAELAEQPGGWGVDSKLGGGGNGSAASARAAAAVSRRAKSLGRSRAWWARLLEEGLRPR
jgi:hypothetical protein